MALFFVMLVLTVAAAMPVIVNDALRKYSTQLSGDADIMVVNMSDKGSFDMGALRETDIPDFSEYITGFFMMIAEIEFDSQKEFCTFFAADFKQQQEYNPIISDNLPDPDYFSESDIIIGENYAREMGIKVGDRINLTVFGGTRFEVTKEFCVAGIAENKGLFIAGNAIFVPATQGSRSLWIWLEQPFASDTVTHAFIKAKDKAHLSRIQEILDGEFVHLNAGEAVDTNFITREVQGTMMPIYFVSVLVTIFCAFTLVVLLRLIFARDKKNYALMRMLGIRSGQIIAINAMTALVICLLGVAGVVLVLNFAQGFMRSLSFILGDTKINALSYIIGIGGGVAISLLCTFLGSLEPRPKPVKQKTCKGRTRVIATISLAIFSCVLISIALVHQGISWLSFICGLIGLAVFIAMIPKVFLHVADLTYRIKPSALTLKYKTLSRSKDWQRFIVFITIGTVVILMLGLNMINLRNNMASSIGDFFGNNQQALSLGNYIISIFADYIWIFDLLCIGLVTLVAITVFCVNVLRKFASIEEARRLVPLGLTRLKNLKYNTFGVFCSFLPILVIAPFLLFVICSLTVPVSSILGAKLLIDFGLAEIIWVNVVCFAYIIISDFSGDFFCKL